MSATTLLPGDTYFSVDTEANGNWVGPRPDDNSLMEIGVVAYNHLGFEFGSFEMQCAPLPNQHGEPSTIRWWQRTAPTLWDMWFNKVTTNASPHTIFTELRTWMEQMHTQNAQQAGVTDPSQRTSVLIMAPAAADYPRLDAYWTHYFQDVRGEPDHILQFRVIDIKSYAMGKLNLASYSLASRNGLLKQYCPAQNLQQHSALHDARYQGDWFFNIVYDRKVTTNL